jgi:hypothetical protein
MKDLALYKTPTWISPATDPINVQALEQEMSAIGLLKPTPSNCPVMPKLVKADKSVKNVILSALHRQGRIYEAYLIPLLNLSD